MLEGYMAILGLRDDFMYFRNGDYFLATRVSPFLSKILRVKDFDKGLITIDILSKNGDIDEDYLDLNSIMLRLDILSQRSKYYEGVEVDTIRVENS